MWYCSIKCLDTFIPEKIFDVACTQGIKGYLCSYQALQGLGSQSQWTTHIHMQSNQGSNLCKVGQITSTVIFIDLLKKSSIIELCIPLMMGHGSFSRMIGTIAV
jgi:hypothetical protein